MLQEYHGLDHTPEQKCHQQTSINLRPLHFSYGYFEFVAVWIAFVIEPVLQFESVLGETHTLLCQNCPASELLRFAQSPCRYSKYDMISSFPSAKYLNLVVVLDVEMCFRQVPPLYCQTKLEEYC